MAKSKSTRPRRKAAGATAECPALLTYKPGKGLLVSTKTTFPETADDKITCAKSIIQAVVAAHDAEALSGENYDIHWPLSLAVSLLEQASSQMDSQELQS
jgi:hypothetical protein